MGRGARFTPENMPAGMRKAFEEQYLKDHAKRQDPVALTDEILAKVQFVPYRAMNVGADEVALADLNKTERRYLEILRGRDLVWIGVKMFRLRMAANTHYTPDFQTLDKTGTLTMIDTKGGHVWEDAQLKIKLAARLFPFLKFVRADLILSTRNRAEALTEHVLKG